MDPMKRLSEIAAKMAETTQVENTPHSSSPDDDSELSPAIHCYDPEHPQEPCPICRGMGVIKYAVAPGDSRFGKLFRCPNNPIEVDEDRQARLRRLSNLDTFRDKTFDNFRTEIPTYGARANESLSVSLQMVKAYTDDMMGWLLLQGAYGTGKTHLAAAVGNERLRHGDMVLFITTPDLLDHLRSTYAPDSDTGYDELFERVRNADLLILDDMGTENPSEWAREKLYQILNHRYSRRMPTIITTNVNADNLDPRIRSRMMDNNVIRRVVINAPDFRSAGTRNEKEQVMSSLGSYADMTFDNFDINTKVTRVERENLILAAGTAEEFAYKPNEIDYQWLVLMGTFGNGKTHLAASIANYRQRIGEDVVFITVPDLLDYLRTAFAPDAHVTFDKLFNKVRNVPLLVLDDLGTENSKPWAREKLFQILDHRYVARLQTVITTAKEIKELDERIVSRIIDQRICRNVALTVGSYAKRMKR